ncbi:MAG: hypothetical protein JNK85_15880 [Verrucomicrobiales bacterium]|nr:hypothetical protein [Verrucomicrobiales bacterium]
MNLMRYWRGDSRGSRRLWAWLAVAVGLGVTSLRAGAQGGGMPGGNLGFNAAVAQLFADVPAFSAAVETAITNQAENTRMVLPMRMFKSGDKFRIDVDFVKLRGAGAALQGLSALQNIGMSRMGSLVLPQEKGMVVFFPELKFQTRVSLTEADLPADGYKVTKKAGGKETVNGQPCVRQQVTLTTKDGQKTEATTWEAPALNQFPVRMMFRQDKDKDGGTMWMTFSDVKLASPGDDVFKVPSDYKSFNSISGLMQEAMARALNPGAAK